MDLLTIWALRGFGFAGMIGALLFMTGDLSYNHIPGSTASPAEKMSTLAEGRLLRAGILALPGTWFYLLADLQLFLAFYPVGKLFAFIFAVIFGMVMVGYGIGHAAYFSIGAGARAAASNGASVESGAKLGNTFFTRLVTIIYVPAGISGLMMVYGILSGRSLYPRWFAIFTPLIIYLIKKPILKLLRGRARELVNDCYDNLVLLLFYLLSTVILWNGG